MILEDETLRFKREQTREIVHASNLNGWAKPMLLRPTLVLSNIGSAHGNMKVLANKHQVSQYETNA